MGGEEREGRAIVERRGMLVTELRCEERERSRDHLRPSDVLKERGRSEGGKITGHDVVWDERSGLCQRSHSLHCRHRRGVRDWRVVPLTPVQIIRKYLIALVLDNLAHQLLHQDFSFLTTQFSPEFTLNHLLVFVS